MSAKLNILRDLHGKHLTYWGDDSSWVRFKEDAAEVLEIHHDTLVAESVRDEVFLEEFLEALPFVINRLVSNGWVGLATDLINVVVCTPPLTKSRWMLLVQELLNEEIRINHWDYKDFSHQLLQYKEGLGSVTQEELDKLIEALSFLDDDSSTMPVFKVPSLDLLLLFYRLTFNLNLIDSMFHLGTYVPLSEQELDELLKEYSLRFNEFGLAELNISYARALIPAQALRRLERRWLSKLETELAEEGNVGYLIPMDMRLWRECVANWMAEEVAAGMFPFVEVWDAAFADLGDIIALAIKDLEQSAI